MGRRGRRVPGRRQRRPCAVLGGVEVVSRGLGRWGEALAEHIMDGWQAIICLISGDVVDVGGVGELRGLVGNVPRQRVRVVHAGEGLVEGSRLYHALTSKMLVGRRDDGKAWGCLVPPRHARSFGGKVVLVNWAVALGRLLLQSRFNDVALLLAHRHATLKLFLHNGVLSDEARRQARDANLLYPEVISRSKGPGASVV